MNSLLLDIRTREEYCSGYLCGAILIETPLPPLSFEYKNNLQSNLYHVTKNISHSTPIYVYCKKGVRADIAVKILNKMGYRNTRSLGGVEMSPLRDIMNEGIRVCRCV